MPNSSRPTRAGIVSTTGQPAPLLERTMAFSTAGTTGPLADINVTPLVDVMLVLLIIFIVTALIVTRPVPLQLKPTARPLVQPEPPPPIALRLDASNQLSWNGTPIAMDELLPRMQEQAREHTGNLPELRIATDEGAEYEGLVKILAAAEATGMQRVAFER